MNCYTAEMLIYCLLKIWRARNSEIKTKIDKKKYKVTLMLLIIHHCLFLGLEFLN